MLKKVLAFCASITFSIVFICMCSFNVSASSKVEDARKGVVMVYCHGEDGDGMGSGFVIGKNGTSARYVVTNFHVIEGNPKEAFIVISRDVLIKTKPIIMSPTADYAVLELEKELHDRVPLPLQKSETVAIAQKVYALGFPGGSSIISDNNTWAPDNVTVSSGIISKSITVNTVATFQIDASINHGNSGGPLIAENGAVIGINRFGVKGASNINGAIKIDELIPSLDSLNVPYELYNAQSVNKSEDKQENDKSDSKQQGNKTEDKNKTNTNATVTNSTQNPQTPVSDKKGFDLKKVFMNKWAMGIGAVVLITVIVMAILMSKRKKSNVVYNQNQISSNSQSPVALPNYHQQRKINIYGTSGYYENQSFSLSNGKLTIGRDYKVCNVVYPPTTAGISSVHCEISYDASINKCVLIDRGSSYGTFLLNGEKIVASKPYYLNPGDSFYLASIANKFEIRES